MNSWISPWLAAACAFGGSLVDRVSEALADARFDELGARCTEEVVPQAPALSGGSTVLNCEFLPSYDQGCTSTVTVTRVGTSVSVLFGSMHAGVNGRAFYGISGPAMVPWAFNSKLCVAPPLVNLPVTPLGGAGACTGSVVATLVSGAPLPTGTVVHMQARQRDFFGAFVNLTDAVTFTMP